MKINDTKGATCYRGFSAEYRAEENKISGQPAVYGQKTNIRDYFYEIIEQGAFDECDLTDVPLFVNHNTRMIPIARSRRNNGKSTMTLIVNNTGLNIDAAPDIENNSEARALYSSVSRGDMSGMSMMFDVADERWEGLDTKMPTRHILKISKLYEVSAVNFPAYTGTNISARSEGTLDSDLKALERAKTDQAEALDSAEKQRQLAIMKMQAGIF